MLFSVFVCLRCVVVVVFLTLSLFVIRCSMCLFVVFVLADVAVAAVAVVCRYCFAVVDVGVDVVGDLCLFDYLLLFSSSGSGNAHFLAKVQPRLECETAIVVSFCLGLF